MANTPKLLHIGFLVDEADFEKHSSNDSNPQVAARKLEGRFITGFKENAHDVTILSFFPATNFPGNTKCFFGFKRTEFAGSPNFSPPFVNLLGLKHVTRFFSVLVYAVFWHLKNIGVQKRISVYSIHSPFVLAALVCKYLFGTHVYLIIPDLPLYMNFGGKKRLLWRMLKKFDTRLTDLLVSKASAVSVVTASMVQDNAKWAGLPFVVIEGIASGEGSLPRRLPIQRRVFLYAGALNAEYGLPVLLSAFEKLHSMGINAELWICGKGAFEDEIKRYASRLSCIKFLGYLSLPELQDVMQQSFCLVNFRNDKDAFVKYSFPSKLLEYLVSGIPVLTTKLPSIPAEYDPFLNYLSSAECDSAVAAVSNLLSQDPYSLEKKAILGREFVLQNKTAAVQASRLLGLMTTVESGMARSQF